MTTPVLERFEVDANGCHVWTGWTTHEGYGRVSVNGRGRYVHRLVWETENGPIADGVTIDHLCFNPTCMNLDHLRELGFLANSRLQRSALATHCERGHEFTEENTIRGNERGRPMRRRCRTCRREWTASRLLGKAA